MACAVKPGGHVGEHGRHRLMVARSPAASESFVIKWLPQCPSSSRRRLQTPRTWPTTRRQSRRENRKRDPRDADNASYQAEVSLRVNRLEPDLFRAFMSV